MATLTALPQELLGIIVTYTGYGRYIASRTDSRALACLARTCKLFHGMCEPLLYHAVACGNILKFVRTLISSPRLAAMVKDLFIEDTAMPWGLTTGTINGKVYNGDPEDDDEEESDADERDRFQPVTIIHGTIWNLTPEDTEWLKTSSDKVLSGGCILAPPEDAENQDSMFCLLQTLACAHCPNMEKLRVPIDMSGNDFRELKDPKQVLFPSLTCFSAQAYAEEFFSPIGERLMGMLGRAPKLERCNFQGIDGLHPNFKSLSLKELHMNVSGINEGEVEQIFSSLPNLENFMYDVHGADMGIIEERPGTLFNALQRYCKKLRRLRLTWNAELQDDEDGDGMEDEDMDDEGEGGNGGGGSRVIQTMGGMSSLRELTLYDGCTSICHVEGDATAVYKKFFPPHIEKISLIQSAGNGPDGAPAFALATLAAIARTHYPQLKLVQVWSLEGTYNKDELEGLFRQAGIELQVFTYDYLTPDPSELFPSDIPSE